MSKMLLIALHILKVTNQNNCIVLIGIFHTQALLLHYTIGHYNPSVRIIDLVSHTTYDVCVNFIHKWRDLHFKVDSERQIFEKFFMAVF